MQSHEPSTQHLLLPGPTDAEIIARIEDIQHEFPCYGYRRVTHELRRRGLVVNHKKVSRIMRLAGLGVKPRKRYVRTTDSRHEQPIHPNLYRNRIRQRRPLGNIFIWFRSTPPGGGDVTPLRLFTAGEGFDPRPRVGGDPL